LAASRAAVRLGSLAVWLGFANAINDRNQVLGSIGSNFGILNVHGVITPINLSGAATSAFVSRASASQGIAGQEWATRRSPSSR
jgi:hypothetical protein